MLTINRRLMLGLAAAGAATRLGTARAAEMLPHEKELYEAARREGQITWYTGQYQAEPSQAIGRGFTERFPGITVNVVRSTSQVAFQRLSQDMRAGVAQCDVFSSTDHSHAAFLKQQGRLMAYKPRNAAGLIQAAKDAADPDGYFQVTYLGLFLMGRRSDVVSDADAPKSWKDLIDPRWRGKIAVGHPGYSGAITSWCLAMRRLYGWDYFKALEKNQPQIGRSSADPVTMLNAGERTIGAALPSATSLLSISRGNPIKLIYPEEGTLMVPAPSGALKDAPHPNAAKLFMEFMTSPTYYEVTRPFFSESLRPEVPPPPGSRPLAEVKMISADPDELERDGQEVKELWRDTFGV
ncbi:ABC transporter substrate-binding protein [Teichococcus oryzae]|uniref:Extracellular solute-binding protein n=1 Tax=Teichococcus oryzae TaxID=1608942 RepID=A0A5B2TIE8_9PROT|nr:extracellular solute-binding protein [Pseudoroseomonas oryzae]KAA2213560.1 extracellular solute-binding protein [Pseudoroseomonas oryzae]